MIPFDPLAPCPPPVAYDPAALNQVIARLAALPVRVRSALTGVSPERLETSYRPGGWTARQIIHHLAQTCLALAVPIPDDRQ